MGTEFRPIIDLVRRHEATADRAARVAVLGSDGCTHLPLRLHRAQEYQAADEKYTLLLVKTALWLRGGSGGISSLYACTESCDRMA